MELLFIIPFIYLITFLTSAWVYSAVKHSSGKSKKRYPLPSIVNDPETKEVVFGLFRWEIKFKGRVKK